MVSVYPARRCTSPLGVVFVGLGDGVGDCHDVASFYFSSASFLENKLYSFSESMVTGFSLLGMLVAKWVPTPCHHDAYSVGTPNRAFREKAGCKTMVSTFLGPFGKQKDIFSFFGWFFSWMFHTGRARQLGLAIVFYSWLTVH